MRVCLCVSQPCACLCLFGHGECAALSRVVSHVTYLAHSHPGRRSGRLEAPEKQHVCDTCCGGCDSACVCHTACLSQLNHSVRVCLCVSQPCACLCLFGHGECAALSHVVSHVTYPSLRETGAAHHIAVQVSLPWVRYRQASRATLSTCGLVLYRQPAAVGSQIFRRTLCQKCIREEKEG